jgi:ribosomal protein S18 acetylase RimI-like enzyme
MEKIHNGKETTNFDDITEFEKMTARAWPAKESENFNGWIMRANDGVTWRANTVLPFGNLKSISLEKALEVVKEFYKDRELPPAFKITSNSRPKGLDYQLQQRGFIKENETYVQTTSIAIVLGSKTKIDVRIEDELISDWIRAYSDTREIDEFSLRTRLDIMRRIPFPKGFALGILNGQIAGVGLGVLQGEWLALFAIRTIDDYLRKGVATAVNRALAKWAQEQGAKNVYLQVEASNAPALSLYSSLRFKTYYKYWYRILPIEG